MAPLGLSALKSLLGRGKQVKGWQPPEACWSRPFGLGWDKPYTVRYASNLDDGPNHGMPLGGFGAGCIGRAPDGNINLWHLDGGEHWFGCCPIASSLCLRAGQQSTCPCPAVKQVLMPPPGGGEPGVGLLSRQHRSAAPTPRRPLSPQLTNYDGVYGAEVRCEAFSPILPGDYQRTSYPVAVFVWTLHNPASPWICRCY